MEQHGNFLSLWDLVKFKYGTYIYHRIANVMRIKNIPYVGGLRQTGPPRRCQKMEQHENFLSPWDLVKLRTVPRHMGM